MEITESKQIAEEFGKFFATIGFRMSTKGGNSTAGISHYLKKNPTVKLSVFLTLCTVTKINKLIENLPNKTSSGNDDITNVILKKLGLSVAVPMTLIFNNSLCSGTFPTAMKSADVIPLFKGGNKMTLTNYWPISLLPTMSKLLE